MAFAKAAAGLFNPVTPIGPQYRASRSGHTINVRTPFRFHRSPARFEPFCQSILEIVHGHLIWTTDEIITLWRHDQFSPVYFQEVRSCDEKCRVSVELDTVETNYREVAKKFIESIQRNIGTRDVDFGCLLLSEDDRSQYRVISNHNGDFGLRGMTMRVTEYDSPARVVFEMSYVIRDVALPQTGATQVHCEYIR